MAKIKGHGAPIGNHNAAGPHSGHGYGPNTPGHSSRFKSFGIAALTGGVGAGVHGAMNASHGNQVRTGMHMLGGTIGGAISGTLAAPGLGTAIGAVSGAAGAGLGSYIGKKIGNSYKKK